MKPNKILTPLLYILLATLVVLAIYQGCEMKRTAEEKDAEEAELRRTLREMGYIDEDTIDLNSTYAGEGDTIVTRKPGGETVPPANKDGIEDEAPVKTTEKPKATTPPPPASTKKDIAPNRERDLDKDSGDGRYRVVAGSFTRLDGARRQLEKLIKMGYQEAEVGRYNHGKYAVVIVIRTDNLNEAINLVDKLERQGIDAGVIDRNRKK